MNNPVVGLAKIDAKLAAAEALAVAGAVLGIEARYAWEQSQNGKRATVSAKAIQDWEAALRQYRVAK